VRFAIACAATPRKWEAVHPSCGETASYAGRRNLAVQPTARVKPAPPAVTCQTLRIEAFFALACVPCAAGSLPYDTTPPFVWKPAPSFLAGSPPLRQSRHTLQKP